MRFSSGLVKAFFFTLLLLSGIQAVEGRDTIPPLPDQFLEDMILNFLEEEAEGTTFDFNTILENLENYQLRPLNLNKVTSEELEDLGLLTELQIENLLAYRERFGKFISIYEIQAVPYLNLPDIRRIIPFVTVQTGLDDFQIKTIDLFKQSENEVLLRYTRILEDQKGYRPLEEGEEAARYSGSPDGLYLRFRRFYTNRFSVGFTAEKDRGEEFFNGSNPYGFDFYSGHLFFRDIHRSVKYLAIGDFNASFGQGLLLYSGFASRKSAVITAIKRKNIPLRAHKSVNEVDFMRGVGATLRLLDGMEWTNFVSYVPKDANLVDLDSLDFPEDTEGISSIQLSGLHRTENEIEDEKSLQQLTVGSSVTYRKKGFNLGLNAVYDQLDKNLSLRNSLENRFRFSGEALFGASIDYSYIYRNLHIFGETAMDENGTTATMNGALLSVGKFINVTAVQRIYPENYHSLRARPFGESANGRNEAGWFTGLEVKPSENWLWVGYFDVWKNAWIRSRVDAPSRGNEVFTRLSYSKRRKFSSYLQIRVKTKEQNLPDNETPFDQLYAQTKTNFRAHLSYDFSKALKSQTRVEISDFQRENVSSSKGFMVYQELVYRSLGLPVSGSLRYVVFDTDDFDSRIFAFEKDVRFAYSIPMYQGKGTRIVFNLKYRVSRNLKLEARYARTYRLDTDEIGSGNELINGSERQEVKLQVGWKF